MDNTPYGLIADDMLEPWEGQSVEHMAANKDADKQRAIRSHMLWAGEHPAVKDKPEARAAFEKQLGGEYDDLYEGYLGLRAKRDANPELYRRKPPEPPKTYMGMSPTKATAALLQGGAGIGGTLGLLAGLRRGGMANALGGSLLGATLGGTAGLLASGPIRKSMGPQPPREQTKEASMPRSYWSDFAGGVDPTGTRTFQYGLEDARGGESSGARRAVGTAGGIVGGAAVVPGAVGGLVGGIKGFAMGRGGLGQKLISAGKGAVSGAKSPYSSLYRGFRANKALAAQQAGKTLTPGQAKNVQSFVTQQIPGGLPKGVLDPSKVQTAMAAMNPKQLAKARQHMSGELAGGAGALGLSGLIGGGSAYAQYGKGSGIGSEIRRPDSRQNQPDGQVKGASTMEKTAYQLGQESVYVSLGLIKVALM